MQPKNLQETLSVYLKQVASVQSQEFLKSDYFTLRNQLTLLLEESLNEKITKPIIDLYINYFREFT